MRGSLSHSVVPPAVLVATLTAKNPTTGDQVTRYVYGTATGGITPQVYRNDLLRAEIYPDSDDTTSLGDGADEVYDRVEFKYNRQGEVIEKKDQNGTVHAYSYDALGRLTEDEVTTFGTSVDDRVIAIARTYEVRGMLQTVTSYGEAASSGDGRTVLNQVRRVYNDFGQLTAEYQEHDGPKDDDTPGPAT